ncbi:ABC transporter permease [Haloarcula nitratireducens]|uniref:ABC transporter permease n=1 Tax=Haloarcula nitratireducens TaxID=2487749 RepID=A0AAW4PHM4_9EURY|nr:ABC transporter permease [Halomicroarcula nitratireducens]MBX0297439.1 ABC transporter permease [Halomicroarcula nitratireducens]
MSNLARVRALLGVAGAQLRHERTRTILAVLGVAMAVLASVLLVSVGLGVMNTGEEKFTQAGRDIWVTGGPVELRPGTVGGFENSLIDAHSLEAELRAREDIRTAHVLIFQTLYISTNNEDFETVIGVGAQTRGPNVNYVAGGGVEGGDAHYADGSYDGPMQHEVVIDQRTAKQYNLSVGDTVYLGGTLATASNNRFTVVGISGTYSQFVGAPTVVMPPSEIQEITGTTASDRATMISAKVATNADPESTAAELRKVYPGYTVRTNREQLQATLQNQSVVLASGLSLVIMAVVAGILLLTNLQLSFVARHRETFGALTAIGTSQRSLAVILLANTLTVGILGGVVGIGLAVPSIWGVNQIAAALSGFEDVVSLSEQVLVAGFSVAFVVSAIGGVAATWYLSRLSPLSQLR